MTTFERPRGVFIQLLDVEKATQYIKDYWNDQSFDITAEAMAVVNGEKGLATLCSEGVGWFADKDGKVPINYWGLNGQNGYIDIPAEDLPSLIHEKNFIDLADFIRNYNDRLENNFYQWKQYANGYEQMSQATATMVA